jgi:hypothetical protein
MGFGPTSLPPIRLPSDNEVVPRVTPDAGAQDHKHREHPDGGRKQNADSGDSPLHDTVDVSEEYRATAHAVEEEAPSSESEATSIMPARRLDIRA